LISKDFQLYLERKITFQILNSLKKILITGESGFIGSHLIDFFVNKYPQYEIHGLDILTYASNRDFTKKLELKSNYYFHKINICDYALLLELFEQYKFTDVIHLAAESHVDNSISDPTLFAKTNVLGTLNLLESFRCHASGRFHHVSTDEVYGDLEKNDMAFKESNAYKPSSPYSASKASSDHFVRAYHRTYDLDTVITNCSNNYGPHQHVEKFIPTIINSIIKNSDIPLYGTGKNIRDWLYVQDHVLAIDLVFNQGYCGQTYNIGSNNEISNLDLVDAICKMCVDKKIHTNPKSLIKLVPDRLGHDKRYAIDYSKCTNDLGWHPKFNFYDSLSETIDWYYSYLTQ